MLCCLDLVKTFFDNPNSALYNSLDVGFPTPSLLVSLDQNGRMLNPRGSPAPPLPPQQRQLSKKSINPFDPELHTQINTVLHLFPFSGEGRGSLQSSSWAGTFSGAGASSSMLSGSRPPAVLLL